MHNFPFWVGQIRAERLPIWVCIIVLILLIIPTAYMIIETIKMILNK